MLMGPSSTTGTIDEFRRRRLTWPLPDGYDDEQLESLLFGSTPARRRTPERDLPDIAALHEQRQKHKLVTLQLLWEEYQAANSDGYPVQPILPPVSALARKPRRCLAPATQSRRKAVRGLGRERPSRSIAEPAVRSGRRICSWRCSAQVLTPMPKRLLTSR